VSTTDKIYEALTTKKPISAKKFNKLLIKAMFNKSDKYIFVQNAQKIANIPSDLFALLVAKVSKSKISIDESLAENDR